MYLENLVAGAVGRGASDLHLEPGLSPAMRVHGTLFSEGPPASAELLYAAARALIPTAEWDAFLSKKSYDASRMLAGARCRINILHSSRGVGFAIRLLATFDTTLDQLNLHPDLGVFASLSHGLVLVSGSTGSGKSTTLAALLEEINRGRACHIVTVESPIEYSLVPKRAFLRQREVGRDTPSFEQALLDALREDPDVLMVGEMREPETMRLTLNASETGHLVFATVHSATAPEALQRIAGSFPAEAQSSVRAMLADCFQGVICQRLRFMPELGMRVPECEILRPTHAVRNFIRLGEFHRIISVIETGADNGMWTFDRYQRWVAARTKWSMQGGSVPAPVTDLSKGGASATMLRPVSNPTLNNPKPLEIEPDPGGMQKILKRLVP